MIKAPELLIHWRSALAIFVISMVAGHVLSLVVMKIHIDDTLVPRGGFDSLGSARLLFAKVAVPTP